MTEFELDSRLDTDCFRLAEGAELIYLLMNNADIPWLILVPKTAVTEWCDLDENLQSQINRQIKSIADLFRDHHQVDKLNIATIGNVVSQLHVHVVGRYRDDYCWPGVVWGKDAPSSYETGQVVQMQQLLLQALDNQLL